MEFYASTEDDSGKTYYITEAIKTDGAAYETILDVDGKVNGVKIAQMGDDCPKEAGAKFSFETELTCAKDVTGTIDVNAITATFDDKCTFTLAFAHKAGCPVAKDFTDIANKFDEMADDSMGWL